MADKKCWLCGANGKADPLEKHHIFGASNRKKSEVDGLTVYLCGNECHKFGKRAVHNCKETMQTLHEYGEKTWLENNPGKSVEDFIRRYGKNYL